MSISPAPEHSNTTSLPVIGTSTAIARRTESEPIVGQWWSRNGDRVVCELCPRECRLKDGDRGFCFVRQNVGGELQLTTFGRSTGFCIDPIEKKPLNHFLPGTPVLSFGTAGCNLGCKFCQNHSISKSRKVEKLSSVATPEAIANAAAQHGCKSVAFTYNDPVIWAEYAISTAEACHERDIKTVAVTAGYISPQARPAFFNKIDAANIDLKSFSETFYQKLTLSHLQPVLDTLVWLKHESDTWFEITNLIIPNNNDSDDELRRLCDWVLDNLGPDVPLHFTAFHPDFRLTDQPRTPHETLIMAHEIATNAGIRYAYLGNVNDPDRQSTYCHNCDVLLIERNWHQLGTYQLTNNRCQNCDTTIPGRFAETPGDWGRKRMPIKINTVSTPESELTETEKETLHRTACELVIAETRKAKLSPQDPSIVGLADREIFGAFVSLKKNGRLRSCVGFSGKKSKLGEGLRYAANRCVHHDTRFPPVKTHELANLELEVWLLGDTIEVTSSPASRVNAIQIGRDGLLIQKGNQRGLLLPGVAIEHGFDAKTFLDRVCVKAGLPSSAWQGQGTKLFRFEGQAVKKAFDARLLSDSKLQHANPVDSVRPPSVAGKFYPADEQSCKTFLQQFKFDNGKELPMRSVMLPHAGWRFSAGVAMATLAQTVLPESVVILAPKHTKHGEAIAVSPSMNWRTPLGDVPTDMSLAKSIVANVDGLAWDDAAHQQDHAIEVLLPMLLQRQPNLKIVSIAFGAMPLQHAVHIGRQLSQVLKQSTEPVSMIVSSDMNHFENDQATRQKDQLALNAMMSRNPVTLYNTVRQNKISMCGVMPAVIALSALNQFGPKVPVRPTAYATSAKISGNSSRVVGYAGVLL